MLNIKMNLNLFLILIQFLLLGSNIVYSRNNKSTKYLYIGTYTDGESKGIYLYKMNSTSGELEFVSITENNNPSFLTIDQNNKFLFAVNEVADFDTNKSGSISSFKIDAKTKELKFVNKATTAGAHPCFVTINNSGEFVLAANYTGGNVSVIPTNNGVLLNPSDIIQHFGSSINKKRQNEPHTHSIYLDNKNKYAYALDLGIDKVNIYKFDSENGKLLKNEIPFYDVKPGSGPRHMVFHPNSKFAYVITELNNKIVALNVGENGGLNKIESYTSLPKDFDGTSYCADIHIHPNGKYLYGSNRGHNSIVIFEINEDTGKLNLLGFQSTKGNWPRNFTIDPSGKFLLVANQKSNDVFVFNIDSKTGLLEETDISIKVPSPVCLTFLND